MQVIWLNGAAHGGTREIVSDRHVIRVREGFGLGQESFGSRSLAEVQWRAGAVEYLPPSLEHRHSTSSESDWLSVQLDAAEWEETRALSKDAVSGPLSCQAGGSFKNPAQIFRFFRLAALGAVQTSADQYASAAAELTMGLLQIVSRVCSLPSVKRLPRAVLHELADYVDQNLDERIHIEDLAAIAHLSKFHFISAFSRSTGITPYRYVLARRVRKASRLLRSGQALANVALDCGFSNQAHLGSVMKQHLGMTPNQFRRLPLFRGATKPLGQPERQRRSGVVPPVASNVDAFGRPL